MRLFKSFDFPQLALLLVVSMAAVGCALFVKNDQVVDLPPGSLSLPSDQVRLMWRPEHPNSKGEVVPAHYYYLKLPTRCGVDDAFELEEKMKGSRN